MTVITCNDLTKKYGSKKVLNDLSLTIEKNKLTGLIGRNGAGKTTLLKIIAGHINKTSGNIYVFSENPFNNLFINANTILISNDLAFPSILTLEDILIEMEKFYKKWDKTFAYHLLDYFSFNKKDNYTNLSKGRKSTFNIILGLASRCALTIYDEPTIGMDVATRNDFYRILLKDYLNEPRSIIITSHHVDEIESILENILLIHEGKCYFNGSIERFKQYAIGLTGETETIEHLISNQEKIYSRKIDHFNSYVVIKNESSIKQFARYGLSVKHISPSELAIYLTNEKKRGIEDAFRKNDTN